MFRYILTGASVIALMSGAAYAGDKKADTKAAADQMKKAAEVLVEPAPILDVAQVSTRDDAKLLAEAEFKQADLDMNGEISKDEFIAYASVKTTRNISEPATTATVTEPANTALNTEPAAEGDADIEANLPATAEEQFAMLSKDDEEISKDEMIEARVAGFEEADANDDEVLDDNERQKFVALVEVKKPANSL